MSWKSFLREVSKITRDTFDPLGRDLAGAETTFGSEAPPAPPAQEDPLQKPTVMPIADDEEIKKKKRRSIAEQRQRRGRASTFMTSEDSLGAA
jgi:hypothetical protein